jgi:hypothetical protein
MVACGGVSAGSGLEIWDVAGGAKVVAEWDTWPESHHGMSSRHSFDIVFRLIYRSRHRVHGVLRNFM